MKRIISGLMFAGVFLFVSCAFAQSVKIVELNGDVTVKKNVSADWEKAKVDARLDTQAEIKTGSSAKCILAFDDMAQNVIQVKENSQLKIESVLPGSVFLPQGRVFVLIDNLPQAQEFQVRTPTAIAGARGTGWLTSFGNNNTLIICFDDMVSVQGFDQQGNPVDQRELTANLGVNIGLDGKLGLFFQPTPGNLSEWNDFRGDIEDARASLETGDDLGDNPSNLGDTSDLREEQKEDYSQETLLQEREDDNRRDSSDEPNREPSEPPSDGGPGEGDHYVTHH